MEKLSKAKMAVYSSLGKKKMREKHGLFAVEGIRSISDTLRHFDCVALIVREGFSLPAWIAQPMEIKIFEVTASEMRQLTSLSTPSDIMAIYRLPEPVAPQEITISSESLYLILDGIQDPGNLGTIIRTAHWFGVEAIFASSTTADIFNPKTIQSTMGSLDKVPVIYCDIISLIETNPDIPVYGTLLNGKNIYETSLSRSGFIIMGNEGQGISPELRKLVTSPLLIPPYKADDHSESLNVATATAVVLSEFRSRLYR